MGRHGGTKGGTRGEDIGRTRETGGVAHGTEGALGGWAPRAERLDRRL